MGAVEGEDERRSLAAVDRRRMIWVAAKYERVPVRVESVSKTVSRSRGTFCERTSGESA